MEIIENRTSVDMGYYKLLAFDLDGTILDNNHFLVEKNRKALKFLRDKGIRTIPTTGRGPSFMIEIIEQLDLYHENEYMIICNGALGVEIKTGKKVFCNTIEFDLVRKICNYGIQEDFNIQIITPYTGYAFNKDGIVNDTVKIYGNRIIFISDNNIEFLRDQEIIKIQYERKENVEYLYQTSNKIKELFNYNIETIVSGNRFIEISSKNTTKATGLETLVKYLGISLEETIAVGDNANDIEMLKSAGLGIAVNNALDSTKEAADCIADSSNNDGVIEEIVNKYIVKGTNKGL